MHVCIKVLCLKTLSFNEEKGVRILCTCWYNKLFPITIQLSDICIKLYYINILQTIIHSFHDPLSAVFLNHPLWARKCDAYTDISVSIFHNFTKVKSTFSWLYNIKCYTKSILSVFYGGLELFNLPSELSCLLSVT